MMIQKMRILGARIQGIAMPNAIQPGEHSTGSGLDGCAHVTDSDGYPNVFKVEHDDNGRWLNSNDARPSDHWNPENRIVFVAPGYSPHFFPGISGEFCFWSWPYHPPSIRPTSLMRSESAMYFLLSNDFVSQRTRRRTLRVSSLRTAMRT